MRNESDIIEEWRMKNRDREPDYEALLKGGLWIIIVILLALSFGFWKAYKYYSNYLDNKEITKYYLVGYVPYHVNSSGEKIFGKTTYEERGSYPNDDVAIKALQKEVRSSKTFTEQWYKKEKSSIEAKYGNNDAKKLAKQMELNAFTDVYEEKVSTLYYLIRIRYTRKFRLDIFLSELKQDNMLDFNSYFKQLEDFCDADPSVGAVGADLAHYDLN